MDYEYYRDKQSCLLLVDGVGVEVPLRRSVCAALQLQAKAGVEFKLKDPFEKISDIVLTSLDSRYVPPSEAQINYVYVIAGALNLPVTSETVSTKNSCHDFISKYVDQYRDRITKTKEPAAKPKRKSKVVFVTPADDDANTSTP
jgi:hypothetical protein